MFFFFGGVFRGDRPTEGGKAVQTIKQCSLYTSPTPKIAASERNARRTTTSPRATETGFSAFEEGLCAAQKERAGPSKNGDKNELGSKEPNFGVPCSV